MLTSIVNIATGNTAFMSHLMIQHLLYVNSKSACTYNEQNQTHQNQGPNNMQHDATNHELKRIQNIMKTIRTIVNIIN